MLILLLKKTRKSEEIRSLNVADRENGETYSAIAKIYKISISGARKIFEIKSETLYEEGRKQKISSSVDEAKNCYSTRKLCLRDKRRAKFERFGKNDSKETVINGLKKFSCEKKIHDFKG